MPEGEDISMRVRVCILLALVPGVLAAQGFVPKRIPSLDLSPKRWSLQKFRPGAKSVLTNLSFRQEQAAKLEPGIFVGTQKESRPCSVDLRLVPHEADRSEMRLLQPKDKTRTRTAEVPAPPCSETANARK
jgi:hypothetical protein